jgi:hypothetical protein
LVWGYAELYSGDGELARNSDDFHSTVDLNTFTGDNDTLSFMMEKRRSLIKCKKCDNFRQKNTEVSS